MDQMTQPTVSEHWRKLVPKDQTSNPSGPPHHAHNNTTTMQCESKTHNTNSKSTHSEMGPVWQNLMHRTVRTAHFCTRIIVHNCCTQHSTEQFWLSSLLTSTQAAQLKYCLLEGRGFKSFSECHTGQAKDATICYLTTSQTSPYLSIHPHLTSFRHVNSYFSCIT